MDSGRAAAPLIVASDAVEAAQASKDVKSPAITERLLELVRQQYPDPRLDDAGIAEIREELEAQIARTARLSGFPLTNADEPAFVFRAHRREEDRR